MIKQWNGVIPAALYIRACLQGGGEPQAGEVTRLSGVEKQPFFTCNLATPPSRGALSQDYWMVAKHENKKNAGKPLVLVINALLHSSCCSCCNLQCCGFLLLPLIMIIRCKDTAKVNFAWIWCFTNQTPARRVTPPWTFTWQNLAPVERVTRSGKSGCLPWQVTPPKRDQIKTRDYMDRRVTPSKWVTSPPPCKQALRYFDNYS